MCSKDAEPTVVPAWWYGQGWGSPNDHHRCIDERMLQRQRQEQGIWTVLVFPVNRVSMRWNSTARSSSPKVLRVWDYLRLHLVFDRWEKERKSHQDERPFGLQQEGTNSLQHYQARLDYDAIGEMDRPSMLCRPGIMSQGHKIYSPFSKTEILILIRHGFWSVS